MNLHICRFLFFITLIAACLPGHAQDYPTVSPLAAGDIYSIAIDASGVYRLGGDEASLLTGRSTDAVSVWGHNGDMLPEQNGDGMAHRLQQIPVWVNDQNGNGIFDNGDYLLFYGEGVDCWRYVNGAYRHQRHAYATENRYFLVIGAGCHKLDTLQPDPSQAMDTVRTYIYVDAHDNDLVNIFKTGQVWLGERFSSSVTSRTITLSLPSAPLSDAVDVKMALANDGANNAQFLISANGSSKTLTINKSTVYQKVETTYPSNGSGTFNIKFDYTPPISSANAYLDYVEISAPTTISYHGRQEILRFSQDDMAKPMGRYIVVNGNANLRAWDITAWDSVYEVPVVQQADGYHFLNRRDGSRQVVLFSKDNLMSPRSVTKIDNQNIASSDVPDMVIIAPQPFVGYAERLANLHRILDGMDVTVLTDQQVYNEFSSGKCDPLAFRELLRGFAKNNNGTHPRHILLFGKGTYDPRNLLGSNGINLVVGESQFSFSDNGNAYCSDDPIGYLDDGESGSPNDDLDVAIGRLPVKNQSEAELIVNKIEQYMTRADLASGQTQGDWRNSIVLLADDADPGATNDTLFAHDAERLATSIKTTYPQFTINRIYADAYSQQSGSIGSYYPEVNNTLKQHMDYGCLLMNYIGHGSTKYIGTERYVEADDINSYTNDKRLTFLITSTCTFGRHDMTDDICGAEQFIFAPAAGIGIISASRPIVHQESFNTKLCMLTLDPENSVGEAWMKAKNSIAVSHCISLIGDPALHLSHPAKNIKITDINGKSIDTAVCDTATVLSEVVIKGAVYDKNGAVDESFNGTLYATVYDREKVTHTQANDNEGSEISFKQQKSILYRGQHSVQNGRFTYHFIVPRDVSYEYAAGKMSHYAFCESDDATGAYDKLFFGGIDTNQVFSESRPTVRLYLNDSTFRSGGSSDSSPLLYAILEDSVGINSVGSGLGHDITATIDNNGNSIITLNNFYQPDLRDSRRGTVSYRLTDLSEGWHTLSLKAWNIFNHSNSATIKFFVQTADRPEVLSFFCHPNPASEKTSLRVEHNCPDAIDGITIEIFDMHGSKLREYKPVPIDGSYVSGPITWDFTDGHGHKVAPGIYLARLTYIINGTTEHKHCKIVKK